MVECDEFTALRTGASSSGVLPALETIPPFRWPLSAALPPSRFVAFAASDEVGRTDIVQLPTTANVIEIAHEISFVLEGLLTLQTNPLGSIFQNMDQTVRSPAP